MREILPEELSDFSECFLTGTAVEVTPVAEVGDYRFTPGALSLDMMETYGKLVRGQTVGQAFAMVSSGNAELGLVALSQTVQLADNAGGSSWQVPSDLYSPIRQDAVLLERASSNEAARAFLAYLRSEKGRATIAQFGYETD